MMKVVQQICILIVLSLSVDAQEPPTTPPYRFCVDENQRLPCAIQPYDLDKFDGNMFYHFLNEAQQEPFDRFAWRNFVALNWPNKTGGVKWDAYLPVDQVFPQKSKPNCVVPERKLHITRFLQTSGRPLIDRRGNYVVYDIHLNKVAADYIVTNQLHQSEGQKKVQRVNFPSGILEPAKEGAVFIKTAWMVVDGSQDFYTKDAVIEVKAEDSLTDRPLCLNVRLGLVGMHIVQKTTIGMGDHWIWSTFEHVNNVPLSTTPKHPARSFVFKKKKETCPPPDQVTKPYNFFPMEDRQTMGQTEAGWQWQEARPYAVSYQGKPLASDKISRCIDILTATQLTNRVWQKALRDTVWKNYMLVSAQWKGNMGGEGFGMGELPRFLSNTSMESFIQEEGSCMSCHNDARGLHGQFSDFSFLLQLGR